MTGKLKIGLFTCLSILVFDKHVLFISNSEGDVAVMKRKFLKFLFLSVAVLFWGAALTFAANLEKGMQADDWSFKDPDGKLMRMADWPGRVLVIVYVDPLKADMNNPFTDAVTQKKNEGILTPDVYHAIGIADCKSTWIPDSAIRLIAAKKAAKYKNTVLFDYDAELRKQWGLKKNSCNIIVVDKKRVCRYICRGRVPDDQVDAIVQQIIALSKE